MDLILITLMRAIITKHVNKPARQALNHSYQNKMTPSHDHRPVATKTASSLKADDATVTVRVTENLTVDVSVEPITKYIPSIQKKRP